MISLYTHYGCHQKYKRCVGKTVEKSEPLCAVDGNVKERSHCGKQYEGSTVQGFSGSSAGKDKGMATHSSILAWRIPWTVQSMGLQRVGHD